MFVRKISACFELSFFVISNVHFIVSLQKNQCRSAGGIIYPLLGINIDLLLYTLNKGLDFYFRWYMDYLYKTCTKLKVSNIPKPSCYKVQFFSALDQKSPLYGIGTLQYRAKNHIFHIWRNNLFIYYYWRVNTSAHCVKPIYKPRDFSGKYVLCTQFGCVCDLC